MAEGKKVIAVVGATGAQGGSVVKFLLKDGKYHVRGLTRKADSPAAQELKKQGVEVVEANQDDVKSLEKAFQGAHGVYGVTNFWESFYDGEIRQGKNTADAAKAAGVKHFVWSTLDNCDVPHFVSKHHVGEHCKQIGLPTTHLYTAFYYENLFKFMQPQKDAATGNVTLNWAMPADKQVPAFSVEDVGAFAVEAFNNPEKWLNKDMKIASEFITPGQMNEILKRVCGPKFSINHLDLEASRHAKFPGAEELYLNMMFFVKHQEDSGIRDAKLAHQIYPGVQTWETFLKNHEELWKKFL